MADEHDRQHRSVAARIGRATIPGLVVMVLGAVVLIVSVSVGSLLIALGLIAVITAPVVVLSRLASVDPRPGERPPVKYGATIFGTIARAIDPTWDRPDDK